MKSRLINYIKNPLIKFLLSFGLFMGLWQVLYLYWLKPDGTIDVLLTQLVSNFSVYLISLFNVNLDQLIRSDGSVMLLLNSTKVLGIAHSCNGLILLVLYSAFITCFKGDFRIKIISIILGIVSVFLINIFRVLMLIWVKFNYPEYLDVSHHYVFTAVVYGFVFYLWMLWVNKLSKIKI